jgi:hypothetical protein
MAIEGKGVKYVVEMDITTIQQIAYSLIKDNQTDKAFELLTSTYCTIEMAKQIIQNTIFAFEADNQPTTIASEEASTE